MSIISINGKISSGKDTVGRIIQYLTSEYKDKYDFLEWRDRVENHGSNTYSLWEIKKYARKLKNIASLLTGVPVEMFEDQEFKKQEMGEQWRMTWREFLQKLGTEAMRDGLHTNVWVNALFADYKAIGSIDKDERKFHTLTEGDLIYPNWIITDMRFPNEMEAVVERKGITIRVIRHPINLKINGEMLHTTQEDYNTYVTKRKEHPSETALDEHIMHYEIINDGTIDDLVEKVREILIKENII